MLLRESDQEVPLIRLLVVPILAPNSNLEPVPIEMLPARCLSHCSLEPYAKTFRTELTEFVATLFGSDRTLAFRFCKLSSHSRIQCVHARRALRLHFFPFGFSDCLAPRH